MKYTELHRHLDVSLRLGTLLELAQKKGLEAQSTTLEAFREKFVLSRPLSDLNAVLAKFSLFPKVLDRPEVLERVAYEAILDCVSEEIGSVEFRFSPGFVSEYSRLAWSDVLDGFEAGVRRALRVHPEMRAGLICIASRDYGMESVAQTVDFFLKHRERFIGFDLAGNEADYPNEQYGREFKRLREAGARITVHAGEASGPENIWAAIETLGATRIGHGISAVNDSKLLEYLYKNGICLEVCPTSNWITKTVARVEDHPLPKFLAAGVPVCINTDDPAIFGVRLPDELRLCREKMGLSTSDIEKCKIAAENASFLK